MKPFTKIASIIFAIVALLHLMRFITHFQLSVFDQEIPLWVNGLGLIVASALSYKLWMEAK